MSNEQISPKQGITMIVMFIIGTSSIMVTGMRAGRDIWIADLLALFASLPIIMIYIRLLTLAPGKDFFQTIEYVIGKTASKLFLIPMTWYAFHLCALVLRNFGQFVVTVALHETPLYAVILLIMVFCIMAARSGLEVLGRWSESFILFLVSFFGLGILLTTKNMNIQNILPVFDSNIFLISRAAFGVLVFPFTQIVVFLLAFPAFRKTSSIKKVFLNGILFGGIVILLTSITDMLVLGPKYADDLYYPTHAAIATIQYGDVLQHMEIIAAIILTFGVFLKLSILLLSTSKGISKIIGIPDYRFLVIPVAFLVINYAIFSFDSMIYYHEWIKNVYPYYASVFHILLPLVLWIMVEWKFSRKKSKQT